MQQALFSLLNCFLSASTVLLVSFLPPPALAGLSLAVPGCSKFVRFGHFLPIFASLLSRLSEPLDTYTPLPLYPLAINSATRSSTVYPEETGQFLPGFRGLNPAD
ncbi:uncharacterized protein BJ171DRAFT_238711 [Polychytrium aggregatum]|uniref:uncharacterized protein n=1 Tax=Polychytrium aggregatum TaxID=110093 RepID=UPI0022FF1767|nr:uncharacterized protein BJ171DRAFT_238711 [Polychytrium aggregatum]KAI9208355.1 hypothetical protein BJ171DRAFT_238711 [Polychytrium aggregatum]